MCSDEVSERPDQLQGAIVTVGWQWVDLSHMRCGAEDPVIVFPFSAGRSSQFPGTRRRVLPDQPDDSLRVEYHEGHEHSDGNAPPAPAP